MSGLSISANPFFKESIMGVFHTSHMKTLALGLMLAFPLAAAAQNPATPETNVQRSDQAVADATKPSHADTKFMKESAVGGLLEVQLGQLAKQNSVSESIQQFGRQMVNDHGKANEELKSLAAAEGITLPSQLDAKHTKQLQRLQKLVSPEFDREYMKMMLEDHKKDIKAFQHEAQKGDDPEVKAYAQRTLPTLRAHLSMVQQTLSVLTESRGHAADSDARNEPATGRPAPGNQ
jgi:putative membrane protein